MIRAKVRKAMLGRLRCSVPIHVASVTAISSPPKTRPFIPVVEHILRKFKIEGRRSAGRVGKKTSDLTSRRRANRGLYRHLLWPPPYQTARFRSRRFTFNVFVLLREIGRGERIRTSDPLLPKHSSCKYRFKFQWVSAARMNKIVPYCLGL